MTTTNLKIGQQVKGTIHDIAFGGSGLLKIEGFVLFVPFTAPGDEIVAEITLLKKGFGEAKIVEIITPSPVRTSPKCPYFGTCMGCQFQHIEYSAQLEIKRKSVEDALTRIGKLNIPPVTITASEKVYFYRERITLHLELGKLGYIKRDNTTILDIQTCPIFADDPKLFNTLHTLFEGCTGRLQITKDKEEGYLIYGNLKQGHSLEKILEMSQSFPKIRGIEITCNRKTTRRGISLLRSEIEGLSFQYSPQAFIQNNFSQSVNIYREILKICRSDNQILDLYSGIGISSCLLASKGKQVLAIEGNKYAVNHAKENAAHNHITGIQFETGWVENEITKALNRPFDALLMNPPREGVHRNAIDAIKNSRIKKIIYIACMPSTLARDLKLLSPTYKIQEVKAFDMFPQTTHVETLAELSLNI